MPYYWFALNGLLVPSTAPYPPLDGAVLLGVSVLHSLEAELLAASFCGLQALDLN